MTIQLRFDIPTYHDLEYALSHFHSFLDKQSYKLESYLFAHCGKWFWVLMYRITKRCGTRQNGHTPIFGHYHRWLWTYKRGRNKDINTCSVCGTVYTESGKLGTRVTSFATKGREADWAALERGYKTATNEAERTAIKKSMAKLRHEDKRITAMRESLIKATRDHDHNTIKDIHLYVAEKKHYKNER